MSKCFYSVKDGVLTVGNGLFKANFNKVYSADSVIEDGNGLSMPYTNITAHGAYGDKNYHVWDDLPLVYTPKYKEVNLIQLEGEHWLIKTVKLHAFSDDNDTLVKENDYNMFAKNLFFEALGEVFFLQNPVTMQAIVIISETPDYQTAKLTIKDGLVKVDNGGYPLALGFCDFDGCAKLCRDYYRHARKPLKSVTMSNTWGDRNGFTRVCRDFVLKEIDTAKELGVDIVQIDDGWQVGSTADLARRDENGSREFLDDFWDLDVNKFPNGMKEVSDYADKFGIKVGMWFAPESHDNYGLIERDIAVLKKAYDEWGIRFFKLDMYHIRSTEHRDQFLRLLSAIYSFGNDVAVQLDVTRANRLNYLCGRQYGTVFVENRYTRSGNYFPHRVLRNLWSLGKYIPTAKFQFELVNPDLYTDCYLDGDPFVPSLYGMDYLFATVMLSNPLFWMEMQFLSKDRIKELKPIISVYKSLRDDLVNADVCPILDKPTGRSFTGFKISVDNKVKYLLLFREVTLTDTVVASVDFSGDANVIISNVGVDVKIADGVLRAKFAKERAYALIEVK